MLCDLIKKFAMDVYVVKKYNVKNNYEKNKILNHIDKKISAEDKEILKKDIDSRIQFAKDSIVNKINGKETRFYVLIKNDNIIGFQTAQIRYINKKYEGWRNFAYILQEYSYKYGRVKNEGNNIEEGLINNILYEDITRWFKTNDVTIEKTATGKNMKKHILTYIVKKGFIPEKQDDERIYLIKDYNNLKNKKELKQICKDLDLI